jgi:hypothetical protein
MGFCRGYSFNTGDLTTCGDVLLNYLEAYESVPWDDLRYMFGEVSATGCRLLARSPGLRHLTGWTWVSYPSGVCPWSHPGLLSAIAAGLLWRPHHRRHGPPLLHDVPPGEMCRLAALHGRLRFFAAQHGYTWRRLHSLQFC